MARAHVLLLLVASLLALSPAATGTAAVRKLTDASFEHDTQASTGQTTGVWFVEFFAPWCGHCKQLAPTWERLAHELNGEVAVAAVDVTANRFTLSRFAEPGLVRGYPTLLLFRGGKVYKYEGARSLEPMAAFARETYALSRAYDVPPPPGAVKRAVAYVSDLAERTGLTLVPLMKKVVNSKTMRGLQSFPRLNDPRAMSLVAWAQRYPQAAGVLVGGAVVSLGTLYGVYKLVFGGDARAAVPRVRRAKRD